MVFIAPDWCEREVLIHKCLQHAGNENAHIDFSETSIRRSALALCPEVFRRDARGADLFSDYATRE